MPLYKRGEIWWAQYTVDGQSFRKSTGQREERLAQRVYQQLKNSQVITRENGKLLSEALKLWLLEQPRSNSEKSSIRVFLQLYQDRPISKVTGFDIRDALAEKSPATYNRTANNIRAAINLAVVRNWCKPVVIPRRKVSIKPPRFLSAAEWKRLYLALPAHLKPIAEFALATGLRKSNVLNLKWESVDLTRGVAWVVNSETKSDKSIPVPLSSSAINALTSQIGIHDTYVFTYKNKPISSVKTAFSHALKQANIQAFRWHDLRHTWASWHVINGTPLAVLKELGGWHDISMVMVYAHLDPGHLTSYANNSRTV